MEAIMSEYRKRITLMGPNGPVLSRRVFLGGALIGTTVLTGALPTPAHSYGGGGGAPSGAGAASGGAAGGTGAGSRSGAGGAGQAKESKATARYQDKPNGNQQCDRCAHFRAPNACQIVEGSISPSG